MAPKHPSPRADSTHLSFPRLVPRPDSRRGGGGGEFSHSFTDICATPAKCQALLGGEFSSGDSGSSCFFGFGVEDEASFPPSPS